MSVSYIHRGSSEFNPSFLRVRNFCNNTKPSGCLWACREETDDRLSWGSENVRSKDFDPYFVFELTEGARVLYLNNKTDLSMYKYEPVDEAGRIMSRFTSWRQIDWVKVAKDYDAVEIVNMTSFLYDAHYSWDVASIAVFNPEVVKVVYSNKGGKHG